MTDRQCNRCGEVNPAEIHTCSPQKEYERGYADAMGWKTQNHLEHLPPKKESTCAECDKKQSDGWALYCVGCLREFYKDDPTNKREWVGLTKDEVNNWELPELPTVYEFAKFVAAKLKEKNT